MISFVPVIIWAVVVAVIITVMIIALMVELRASRPRNDRLIMRSEIMNRYICTNCGEFSYSSVSYKNTRNKKCPYPKCNGKVIPAPENQKCRVCGCTWDNACPGGCYWVEPDLCSACAEKEAIQKRRKANEAREVPRLRRPYSLDRHPCRQANAVQSRAGTVLGKAKGCWQSGYPERRGH